MKKLYPLFYVMLYAAYLLTSGCYSEWEKPGYGKLSRNIQLVKCEKMAYSKYPPKFVSFRARREKEVPGYYFCKKLTYGNFCSFRPPYIVSGGSKIIDINEGQRHVYVMSCMNKKGFSLVNKTWW